MEIKASDEVIQQKYRRFSTEKESDDATELFNCQECGATIPGVKLFIKHHENHILKKTVAGSKKDILISASYHSKQRKNSSNEIHGSHLTNTLSSVKYELHTDDDATKDSFKDNIEEDLANYDVLSDFNASGDELNSLDDKNDLTDHSDSVFMFSKSKGTEEEQDNSLCQLSDLSDVESDYSFGSDTSYQNLVDIVKIELNKPDDEQNVDLNLVPNENGHYVCDVCNLKFNYKFILALHWQKNHTAYHEFDVDLQEDVEHQEQIESDTSSIMNCSYCGNSLHKSEFKNHVLVCREENSFNKTTLCQICGKMCNLHNLEKHMQEHKKLGLYLHIFGGCHSHTRNIRIILLLVVIVIIVNIDQ